MKVLLLIPLVMILIIAGVSMYPRPGGWVEVFKYDQNDTTKVAQYNKQYITDTPLTASHYLAGSPGYVLFHPNNVYSPIRLKYFHRL